MTVELEIDPVYEKMLKTIEKESPGDPKQDIERLVENEIHRSYQQTRITKL